MPNPKVKKSISYVKSMNKIKKGFATAMVDYDTAIVNSTDFQEKILPNASFDECVAVLFQMIYFLKNPELALRASATGLLDAFLSKYYKDIIDYSQEDMKPDSEDLKNRSTFISFHLLPSLRSIINTKGDELTLKSTLKVLKKYLQVTRDLYNQEGLLDLLKELKVTDEFLDLACVIDEKDENVDFFESILNIKLQRRYKAIRLIIRKIDSKEIHDLKTLTKILLPIADMFIIRMSQRQSSSRGVISYTMNSFEQINNECYLLYETISKALPWNLYQGILRKNIIKITGLTLRKGQRLSAIAEKNMTKIICSIINGFHFDIPDVVDELEKTLGDTKNKGGMDEMLDKIFGKEEKIVEEVDDGLAYPSDHEEAEQAIQEKIESILDKPEVENKLDAISNKKTILKTLTQSFIPSLFKHLKEKAKNADTNDDYKIRIHVAVAIVRLLRKTTNQDFNTGYMRLVRNIVGCLRSKLINIRDRARNALVQVNLNVSGYLLHFTVDELQKGLRKGYQRHIKSYTLHHLLD